MRPKLCYDRAELTDSIRGVAHWTVRPLRNGLTALARPSRRGSAEDRCARLSPPIPTASTNSRQSAGDLLLDWSKCAVTSETMALLDELAEAADVEGRRDAMFAGEKINITENRAVLHTALRNAQGRALHGRRRGRDAGRPRRARRHGGIRRRRALRQGAPAPPARRSPTSSISASAAPTSARPWRRWRWRPITTGRARISSPTSTAPISPTR